MKNLAIIGIVVIGFGVAAYYLQPEIFGVNPELVAVKKYTACQAERCLDVDLYVVSQGCLIEAAESGELKSQVICGDFIVKQNHP